MQLARALLPLDSLYICTRRTWTTTHCVTKSRRCARRVAQPEPQSENGVSALPTGQSVSQWGARGQRVDQVVHGYCFVVSLAAMGFKHAYQTDAGQQRTDRPLTAAIIT